MELERSRYRSPEPEEKSDKVNYTINFKQVAQRNSQWHLHEVKTPEGANIWSATIGSFRGTSTITTCFHQLV